MSPRRDHRPARPALAAALAGAVTLAAPGQEPEEAPRPRVEGQEAAAAAGDPTRLPPVLVTVRKWEEPLHTAPLTISVIDAATIEEAGLRSVSEASRLAPNVLITEFTSRRLSLPFVRGVGAGQGEPAVTTFIDGVPQLTVSSTNLPLLDIERVEFVRGPLGALYGRNTVGGSINLFTAAPPQRLRVRGGATVGNFDLQEYQLSVALPVVQGFGVGLAGSYARRDGYTVNEATGNDVDFREAWFGRAQFHWAPDERNDLRVVLHGEQARDGGFALFDLDSLRARPRRIMHDFEGRTSRDLGAASFNWTSAGDCVDLTWIGALTDWEIGESTDFDFTAFDAVRRFTDEDQTSVYQEIRLASPAGSTEPLRWLMGASGFWADSARAASNEFRPAGAGIFFPPGSVGTDRSAGDFEDYSWALFGQATLSLAERLELTAALRYDFESRGADIDRTFATGGFVVPTGSVDQRHDFDEILPRFSAAYRWSPECTTYVSAARGFKAGGFNLTAPVGQASFEPETSWTYEAGVKTTWLQDRLRASAAIFHIDWEDMQLSQFDPAAGGFVTNAGESRSRGVELEVVARPASALEIFGTCGFLDTEFERFTDQFGQDVSGRDLPFAPETTWSAGAQWSTDLHQDVRLFVRADYADVGEFSYDAGNLAQERYATAGLRAGLAGPNWRVEGWVRNAFDDEFVPVAFQPNPVDPTRFVGESGAPRTFGVSVKLEF
jgi:iron complex outermembrane receptor protein